MPRVCTVCSHPLTATIAKAIAAGDGSNRSLAARFSLTVSAIQRHRVGCLRQPRRGGKSGNSTGDNLSAGSIRFETNRGEISSPKDLLTKLSTLFRLGDLLEEAYAARDVDSCVKLAREYRAAAESYARIAGWLVEGGGNTTLIDARRQSIQLLGKLTEQELRALAAGGPVALSVPAGEVIDGDAVVISSGSPADARGL